MAAAACFLGYALVQLTKESKMEWVNQLKIRGNGCRKTKAHDTPSYIIVSYRYLAEKV